MSVNHPKSIRRYCLIALALSCAFVLAACASPTSAPPPPTAVSAAQASPTPPAPVQPTEAPTATPVPPSPSPTVAPPTATNTSVPATATPPPPTATPAPPTATPSPEPSPTPALLSADKLTALQLQEAELESIFGEKELAHPVDSVAEYDVVYRDPARLGILQETKPVQLFDVWGVQGGCPNGAVCQVLAVLYAFETPEDAKKWHDALEAYGNLLEGPEPITWTSQDYWDDATGVQNVTGTSPGTGGRPSTRRIYVGLRKGNVVIGMNVAALEWDEEEILKRVDAIVTRYKETLEQEGLE